MSVQLVDHMPRENLDQAIVDAARVSYQSGTTASRSNEGLIRYLLRHWHTTPFEMVEFKFRIKMPMYIARQHMRHRTASINEVSARYSKLDTDYFVPPALRTQSSTNKQSSESIYDSKLLTNIWEHCNESFELYNALLEEGCSRELARGHLPLATYTEFYWKINLHNLMHYLQLRLESGAQEEIRWYAQEILRLVEPLAPLTFKAFRDFRLNSIQLSSVDVQCIRDGTLPESPGERRELIVKMKSLGIYNEDKYNRSGTDGHNDSVGVVETKNT